MGNSTPNVVRQPVVNAVRGYPSSDPNDQLALLQYSQHPYPLEKCLITDSGLFPVLPDTRAVFWGGPGSSGSQGTTTQWPGLVMDPPSSLPHDHVSSNQPTYRDDMYDDGFGTGHVALIANQAQSGIEVCCNNTHHEDYSLQSSLALHYQPSGSPHRTQFPPPVRPNVSPEGISSPSPQVVSQSRSEECYTLWKKIPMEAIIVTGLDKFVPQALYKPLTEADKERYLEQVSLSPPIIFVMKDPFEWGIPLEDIRNGKTQRLVDGDAPVLQNCGPSVSIRINWPGYSSFKRQISSRNWRKTKGPITKEKLAQSVAKTTDQFIEKMSQTPLEVGAESTWRVGSQHIKAKDLILVSLHHVSKGSWQPHFRLRRDLARTILNYHHHLCNTTIHR